MRSRSLVICMLLTIFVVLLLPIGAQATEYRKGHTEVRAEDILKHIENGDDINLHNCRIIGKLDISKINLKTVPNPAFNETVGELFDDPEKLGPLPSSLTKEKIIENRGLRDKLSVIEGTIEISDSTFTDNVSFVNTKFNNSADFAFTNFTKSANFSGVIFNDDAYFVYANFNDDSRFSNANFNSSADYHEANFNDDADFSCANFNDDVDFENVNFNDDTGFFSVDFNDDADFENANFNDNTMYDDAYFVYANFNSSANFRNVAFNMRALFQNANFNNVARFDYANFNDNANFVNANFKSSANFVGVNFNRVFFCPEDAAIWLDFDDTVRWAIFNGDTNFNNANFNSPVYFMKENFNSSSNLQPPDTSENIITTDEKACEIFMKPYNNEARYADADNIYYNYRNFEKEKKDLIDFSKWIDILSWITCGYGLKLTHTIGCSVFIILLSAILYRNPTIYLLYFLVAFQFADLKIQILTPNEYKSRNNETKNNNISLKLCWQDPGIYRLPNKYEKKSTVSFMDTLNFSINTFTILGSSKWFPRDNFNKLVTIEGFLGFIMLGIFMATLSNTLRISHF